MCQQIGDYFIMENLGKNNNSLHLIRVLQPYALCLLFLSLAAVWLAGSSLALSPESPSPHSCLHSWWQLATAQVTWLLLLSALPLVASAPFPSHIGASFCKGSQREAISWWYHLDPGRGEDGFIVPKPHWGWGPWPLLSLPSELTFRQ